MAGIASSGRAVLVRACRCESGRVKRLSLRSLKAMLHRAVGGRCLGAGAWDGAALACGASEGKGRAWCGGQCAAGAAHLLELSGPRLLQQRPRRTPAKRGQVQGVRARKRQGYRRVAAWRGSRYGFRRLLSSPRFAGGRAPACKSLGPCLQRAQQIAQLQLTCTSACAHGPGGPCASAALARDESADPICAIGRSFGGERRQGEARAWGRRRGRSHALRKVVRNENC